MVGRVSVEESILNSWVFMVTVGICLRQIELMHFQFKSTNGDTLFRSQVARESEAASSKAQHFSRGPR